MNQKQAQLFGKQQVLTVDLVETITQVANGYFDGLHPQLQERIVRVLQRAGKIRPGKGAELIRARN